MRKTSKNLFGRGIINLFCKPTPEELRVWMDRTKAETIDLVFEYLSDKDCLNKQGKELAHNFWKEYISDKAKKSTAKPKASEIVNNSEKRLRNALRIHWKWIKKIDNPDEITDFVVAHLKNDDFRFFKYLKSKVSVKNSKQVL